MRKRILRINKEVRQRKTSYSKLVIISTHELDRRITTLFQIKELLRRGVNLEYWNVSKITYKEHVKAEEVRIKTEDIKSWESFRNLVKRNVSENTLYIVYTNYAYKTLRCYLTLSRYNAEMLYCINGVLPPVLSSRRNLSIEIIGKALKNRFAKFLLKTPLIKPVRYELLTCANAGHAHKTDTHTISLPFNSTDYEDSLHSEEKIEEEAYIVFLDQYLPLHPDNLLAGEKGADVSLYYEQMRNLFDEIEKSNGCKVVVAAHPAAKSYSEKNPFGGRKLITGKTKELVKHSKAVVAHFSTAIYFAVIYEKPLLLVSSKDIEENLKRVYTHTIGFAKALKCEYMRLEELPQNLKIGGINDEAYKQFRYGYITTPESETISNAEILTSVYNGKYE